LSITGAMNTTPTAADEVLQGLLPLCVMTEAEALAGRHRLDTQLHKPRVLGYRHKKVAWDINKEPVLVMVTDKMIAHFLNPSDYHKVSVNNLLKFIQGPELIMG